MIEAKIIADSDYYGGERLTTMQVKMHRFVLSEFNTHRKFSRNSASSRAIPLEKQLAMVKQNPAMPLEWRREQSGMQAGGVLEGNDLLQAQWLWEGVLADTITIVEKYLHDHPEKETRLHKSWVNRLLEPFMWHTVCVSSTEWENFFRQRCSPLAQPEIKAVADAMKEALNNSYPTLFMGHDIFHTPYVPLNERVEIEEQKYKPEHISVARCARTSYLTQEGVRDLSKDQELYERLLDPGDGPPHWSPFEHVARIPTYDEEIRGNFDGWIQLRQIVGGS